MAAILNGGKIEFAARHAGFLGDCFAVKAEASNAAIGVDFQAHVREAAGIVDGKRIFGVAGERGLRQQLDPARCGSLQAVLLVLVWGRGSEIARIE